MARLLVTSAKQLSTPEWNNYLTSTRLMFPLSQSWIATWVWRLIQCKMVRSKLTPDTWNTTTISTISQPSSIHTAPLQPWPFPPSISTTTFSILSVLQLRWRVWLNRFWTFLFSWCKFKMWLRLPQCYSKWGTTPCSRYFPLRRISLLASLPFLMS